MGSIVEKKKVLKLIKCWEKKKRVKLISHPIVTYLYFTKFRVDLQQKDMDVSENKQISVSTFLN